MPNSRNESCPVFACANPSGLRITCVSPALPRPLAHSPDVPGAPSVPVLCWPRGCSHSLMELIYQWGAEENIAGGLQKS